MGFVEFTEGPRSQASCLEVKGKRRSLYCIRGLELSPLSMPASEEFRNDGWYENIEREFSNNILPEVKEKISSVVVGGGTLTVPALKASASQTSTRLEEAFRKKDELAAVTCLISLDREVSNSNQLFHEAVQNGWRVAAQLLASVTVGINELQTAIDCKKWPVVLQTLLEGNPELKKEYDSLFFFAERRVEEPKQAPQPAASTPSPRYNLEAFPTAPPMYIDCDPPSPPDFYKE